MLEEGLLYTGVFDGLLYAGDSLLYAEEEAGVVAGWIYTGESVLGTEEEGLL